MKYYVEKQNFKNDQKRVVKLFNFTLKSLTSVSNVDTQQLLDNISFDLVKTLKRVQHTDVNWSYAKLYNSEKNVLAHTLLTEFSGEVVSTKSKVPTTAFFFNVLTKQTSTPFKVTLYGVPEIVMNSTTEHYQKLNNIQAFLTEPFTVTLINQESGERQTLSLQYLKGYLNTMTARCVADIAVPFGWFVKQKVKKSTPSALKRKRKTK